MAVDVTRCARPLNIFLNHGTAKTPSTPYHRESSECYSVGYSQRSQRSERIKNPGRQSLQVVVVQVPVVGVYRATAEANQGQ